MKKQYVIFIVLLVLATLFLAGCGSNSKTATNAGESDDALSQNADFGTSDVDWRTYELTDINGKSLQISKFTKPVFVETFAVWCTNCKKQQQEVSLLHDELGDDFVTIAIEIDPNAVESDVADYVAENNFKSRYIVAPQEFTQGLVDEFGAAVVSAPSVPMVFICGDEVTLLRRGIKPSSELKALVEGCNV